MKCFSRSTLGVIIGGINVLLYAVCAMAIIGLISSIPTNGSSVQMETYRVGNNVYQIGKTVKIHENKATTNLILSTLISVCLVMIIISGLLIVGIVKRRHQLMWPWLALNAVALVCSCFRVISSVVIGLVYGTPVEGVLALLVISVLGVGVQALFLWPIWTLCRDIMQKNKEKSGQVMQGVQYSYVTPDAPPQYNYYNAGLPQKS